MKLTIEEVEQLVLAIVAMLRYRQTGRIGAFHRSVYEKGPLGPCHLVAHIART